MRKIAALSAGALLLLAPSAFAQGAIGSNGIGGGAPPGADPAAMLFNRPLDLGTGSLTANGGINSTGASTLATMTLNGAGTALSVTNSAEFGTGGSAPITLSNGSITVAGGNLGLFVPSGDVIVMHDSTNGIIATIGGVSSSVTGRMSLTPGTSNGSINFLAEAISPNTSQSWEFSTSWSSGAAPQILFPFPNLNGTYTEAPNTSANCNFGQPYLTICNNTDTLAGGGPILFNVGHNFGGSGTTGGRIAANIVNTLTSSTSDTTTVMYQALNVQGIAKGNVGGNSSTFNGNNFAEGITAELQSGATYYAENAAREDDIAINTGASASSLHGDSVILLASNAVAPITEGIGFAVAAQPLAVPTLTYAFSVGRNNGGHNPLSSGGTILGYINTSGQTEPTLLNGINISGPTYTGNTWNDGHISLTGAGDSLLNSATALSTTATAGFIHLPNSAGAPTGTPGTISGDACEINTSTETLNCYIGSGWYHIALTSGAG